MKNIFKLLLSALLVFNGVNLFSQCKAKQIVKEGRAALKPFFYDGYALSEITFTGKPQKIEVEFTAFAKQKYRMVFCTSNFTEVVPINIYDKSSRSKVRNNVFTNASVQKAIWNLTPAKTTTYFITYEIPASTEPNKKGCVLMLIGYSDASNSAGFDE
jgi:hypothetical protein